jgi:hypothetical protein
MITELARRKRLELPLEARLSYGLTVSARAYSVTKTCIRRQNPIESPGLTQGTASWFRVTLPLRSWYLPWYTPRRKRFSKNYKTIATGYHETVSSTAGQFLVQRPAIGGSTSHQED